MLSVSWNYNVRYVFSFDRLTILVLRDHSFSTYGTFSEKLMFLPHDTHTQLRVSRGKKY